MAVTAFLLRVFLYWAFLIEHADVQTMNILLFSLGTIVLYSIGAVLQWMRIKGYNISRLFVLSLVSLGAVFHAVCLVFHIYTPAGVVLNFFTVGSLCGWAVVLIVLLSSFKKPLDNIFAVLLPWTALAVLCAWLLRGSDDVVPNLTAGIIFHIIISILAYSTLTVAALQACLLAYQEHKLKHHAPGNIFKVFPPMETMEHLLFEFILAGMILLTASMISGFVFFSDLMIHHLSHETVLSLTSWVIFGALLLGRYFQGWRGQRAIRWTLAGFLILMLSYFGSKFLADMLWS